MLSENQRLTPYRAGLAGVIQNKIYWYTGSNYIYAPAGETASLVTLQLKPMTGFWLKANQACTMFVYPNPASPETFAAEILNQAPAYLSAGYGQATDGDWAIQLIATAGGVSDWQNYVGVKPTVETRRAQSAMEAPRLAAGFLTLAVRPFTPEENGGSTNGTWMAASYGEPISVGRAWDVFVATDLTDPMTLTWDNVSNLPSQYEAYLIGGAVGSINLRKTQAMVVP